MIDIEYVEIDSLLYPNIQFDDSEAYDDLGKYGNLQLNYLHKQNPQLYSEIVVHWQAGTALCRNRADSL